MRGCMSALRSGAAAGRRERGSSVAFLIMASKSLSPIEAVSGPAAPAGAIEALHHGDPGATLKPTVIHHHKEVGAVLPSREIAILPGGRGPHCLEMTTHRDR